MSDNVVTLTGAPKTLVHTRPIGRLSRPDPDEIGEPARLLVDPLWRIRSETQRLLALYRDADEVARLIAAEVDVVLYPKGICSND